MQLLCPADGAKQVRHAKIDVITCGQRTNAEAKVDWVKLCSRAIRQSRHSSMMLMLATTSTLRLGENLPTFTGTVEAKIQFIDGC